MTVPTTPDSVALRDTLARLHLSQMQAAAVLGVNPRTVRGWCEPEGNAGHRDVPALAWRLLDLYEHVPAARRRMDARRRAVAAAPEPAA